jgi:hypothetical protein
LNNTAVSYLDSLAGLINLRELWLTNTKVTDLTPIAKLRKLSDLRIDNTPVEDLTPLAEMTSSQDAAFKDFRPFTEGLRFQGSMAASVPPFYGFAQLEQPASTIETINELRRRQRLPEYIPDGYERPTGQEASDHEQLAQKPASHSFALRRGLIEAHAQVHPPRYPDVADDIRNEVDSKAKEALGRLSNCNAPRRLISTVDRLGASLGQNLADVRAGVLQMRFRSLEADVAAYDTEDGRRELPEDALAMLRDLTSSVEDLMGCFPQLADIEAERLAQRLKDADVPNIIDALSQIRDVAEKSEAVAPSAIEALKVGEPELEHDTEIIDSGASEASRIAATNARDRTVGYMLLVYRNFVAL